MIKSWSMILLVAVMSGGVVSAELQLVARTSVGEFRQFSAELGKIYGVSNSGQA